MIFHLVYFHFDRYNNFILQPFILFLNALVKLSFATNDTIGDKKTPRYIKQSDIYYLCFKLFQCKKYLVFKVMILLRTLSMCNILSLSLLPLLLPQTSMVYYKRLCYCQSNSNFYSYISAIISHSLLSYYSPSIFYMRRLQAAFYIK